MKKVIVANYRYYVSGGPEVYMFKFMEKSKDIGYESIPFSVNYSLNRPTRFSKYFISSRSNDSIYYSDIKRTPMSIYRTLKGAFYNTEAVRHLKKLIREEKPNALYALQVINTLSPAIFKVAKKKGLKVIHRISDFNLICPKSDFLLNENVCELCLNGDLKNGISNKCYHNSRIASIIRVYSMLYHRKKRLYDYVDFFVTPTDFTRNKLIEAGFDKNKIVKIPTFIDSSKYMPNYENYDYLLFLGRMVPEKGVKYAIQAMKYLKYYKNIKLKITGYKQDMDDELLLFIDKNKLNDVIDFVGFVHGKELDYLIANCMVVLCPAIWYENMPNTVLEAFAYGKPVIASNFGCFPELIENNVDGFLFEPKNVISLADKIKVLLDDKTLCKKMGLNGRKKVEEKYNSEQHFKKLEYLLES